MLTVCRALGSEQDLDSGCAAENAGRACLAEGTVQRKDKVSSSCQAKDICTLRANLGWLRPV